MKLKLILTFILLICINTPLITNGTTLLAQTEEELQEEAAPAEIDDFSGLRATLKQYTQDPDTKEVKFEMILESTISSDRVRVTWDLEGRSIFATSSDPVVEISIEEGQTYTIPITVIPTSKGITELFGKVESFELGNSFLVTVRKNYASNEAGEILPITDEYKSAKLQSTLIRIVKYIVLMLIAIAAGLFGLKALKAWYSRDDVKAFDSKDTM